MKILTREKDLCRPTIALAMKVKMKNILIHHFLECNQQCRRLTEDIFNLC